VAAGIVEPDRRVTIVEPIASWHAEFEAIADLLRRELGSLAVRIDHIGSTAVPGLPAKDVIDLQVTVASLDRGRLVPAFLRAGFVDQAGPPARPARMTTGASSSSGRRPGGSRTSTFAQLPGPTSVTRCSFAITYGATRTQPPRTPTSSEGSRR